MAATVQALNLTKVYRRGDERVYAVNNISLEVYPGELVTVVGRPSSGKSTLLHILGCLQRLDSGQIRIEGLDMTQLEDEELAQVHAHRVGFIFQASNLLRHETTLKNVEVSLRHQGLGAWDRREKAEEVLRVVGLGNRLEHRIGQLSAEQRQCVAIARAMVHDPAIIFADEPTRALDSTSREEVMGLFQKLNDEGWTIVIATSDSGVASYCRRVVRIAEGRTVDDEPVSKRRIIPRSRIPGSAPSGGIREMIVCPQCNYGNFKDEELCKRCESPLHLTKGDEQRIEGRLSGLESGSLGVESASAEGEVPGNDLIEELKKVPFFAGLDSKSIIKIIPVLEQPHFLKGSTIVKQGDVGDSFYIIKSGKVQVVLEREGTSAIPVAQLGPKCWQPAKVGHFC